MRDADMTTTIRRGRFDYEVSLELWVEDGEQRSGCWIIRDDGASASLECADNEGILDHDTRGDVPIPQDDVDACRAWAEANGY